MNVHMCVRETETDKEREMVATVAGRRVHAWKGDVH